MREEQKIFLKQARTSGYFNKWYDNRSGSLVAKRDIGLFGPIGLSELFVYNFFININTNVGGTSSKIIKCFSHLQINYYIITCIYIYMVSYTEVNLYNLLEIF